MLFRVETQEKDAITCEPIGKPELAEQLVPFAKTSGDRSYATFWLNEGSRRILHLGSEDDGLCTLGKILLDFLQLLAIGNNELCVGLAAPEKPLQDSPEWGMLASSPPFRDWLRSTYGATIPVSAGEIVSTPPNSFATASEDPLWQWVRKHQG